MAEAPVTIVKPPNLWGSTKDQKFREHFNGLVEVKAKAHGNELRMKAQFDKDGVMELILQYELSVLLDERTRSRSIEIIGLMRGQKVFALDIQFIRQNEDYICSEIQKRLASNKRHLYVDKETIQYYLQEVDKVFRAKLAAGEEISAVPYTSIKFETREPKKGQARPVILFGVYYPTIAAAQRANPSMNYDTIRQESMRGLKRISNE